MTDDTFLFFVVVFVVAVWGARGCHCEKDVHMREESFDEDTYFEQESVLYREPEVSSSVFSEVMKSPDKEFYY